MLVFFSQRLFALRSKANSYGYVCLCRFRIVDMCGERVCVFGRIHFTVSSKWNGISLLLLQFSFYSIFRSPFSTVHGPLTDDATGKRPRRMRNCFLCKYFNFYLTLHSFSVILHRRWHFNADNLLHHVIYSNSLRLRCNQWFFVFIISSYARHFACFVFFLFLFFKSVMSRRELISKRWASYIYSGILS